MQHADRTSASSADARRCRPIVVSSRTGEGLDGIVSTCCAAARNDVNPARGRTDRRGDGGAMSRKRAPGAKRRCGEPSSSFDGGGGDELVAAEIRGAIDELGKVVGAVYTDDLLDRIFSSVLYGEVGVSVVSGVR